MLVLGFPVGPLQANCYVIARGEGESCVIVDPGQDAADPVREQVRKYALTPEGVLLTHGHFDHVLSAGPIAAEHGCPAWVHPADRYMLDDPGAALGPAGKQLFGDGPAPQVPDDVRDITDGQVLDVAGMRFEITHTPGHTGGSVLFATGTEEGGRLLLAGDTLFAGAIGRTDLPGGDHSQMLRSLSALLPLDDETVVLPGHGPTTTIGRERASNPFLQELPAPDAF